MNYSAFSSTFSKFPIISSVALKSSGAFNHALKMQLTRWARSGRILRLRKNMYLLNENDRKINPSRVYLSSEIYGPSYVSMEYALAYYGLIPEKVSDITCITSRKTMIFNTPVGTFRYQHIKQDCFTGFMQVTDEAGLPWFIASPEKALIDMIYLNIRRVTNDPLAWLRDSLRLQNTSSLKQAKVKRYAALFNNAKLTAVIEGFLGSAERDRGKR